MSISIDPSVAFDPSLLRELERSVGESSLGAELLRIYRRTSFENLRNLGVELNKGDASEVARLAHSLKSSSAQIGVFKVSALAKALEVHMRMAGDLETARSMAEALRVALEEVDPMLEAELELRAKS